MLPRIKSRQSITSKNFKQLLKNTIFDIRAQVCEIFYFFYKIDKLNLSRDIF